MNFDDFFKVKFFEKKDLTISEQDGDEVMIITGKDGRVLNKEDYEKIFSLKNFEKPTMEPLKKRKNPEADFF